MQLTHRFRSMVDVAVREGLKFLTVGGIAYIVDTGLFNLLRLTVLDEKPITAKFISAAVATLVAWQGNRSWTFRHRRNSPPLKELVQFVVVNLVGMAIMMGCLAISHYVLGFTSPLADNISANVVGLAISMVVRFWLYRTWVFNKEPVNDALATEEPAPLVASESMATTDAVAETTTAQDPKDPNSESHVQEVRTCVDTRPLDPRTDRATSAV